MSYGSRVIGPNIKWPHGGAIPGLSELGRCSLLASKECVCKVSQQSDQWCRRYTHMDDDTHTWTDGEGQNRVSPCLRPGGDNKYINIILKTYIYQFSPIVYIGNLKIADLQAHNATYCELVDLLFSNRVGYFYFCTFISLYFQVSITLSILLTIYFCTFIFF